jgi:hypothetical protein
MSQTKAYKSQTGQRKKPYGRWALTLVVFPALVILGAVFGVERVFGLWLGNQLGLTFICYLIGLTIVAAIYKVITDKRFSIQNRADTNQPQHPTSSDQPSG